MIIVIDFDETLFPTLERVIEIYNKQHDTPILLSQITTYNLYECLDETVADEILNLFVDKSVYDNLQPHKGAVRAVQILVDDGNEVYIATATDVRNLEWKEQLLQKYFPFVPKWNLIRIHNKKLLNCDIMIEDNLDTLTKTAADRICFNQPWNHDDVKTFVYDIHHVNSWSEIVSVINKIKKENKEWKE